MRKLFASIDKTRKLSFVLETTIFKNENTTFVLKSGNKIFLEKIKENRDLLVKTYGEDSVSKCQESEEGLLFDFVNGNSFASLLLNQQSKQGFEQVLKKYKDFVIGKSSSPFERSDEFNKIFGEYKIAADSLPVSNIDLTFGNLFLSNSRPVIIDYEWVFSFKVPLKFIFYRACFDFFSKNKISVYSLDDSLKFFEISKAEIKAFETMNKNFFNYVHDEKYIKTINGLNIKLNYVYSALKDYKSTIEAEKEEYSKLSNVAQSSNKTIQDLSTSIDAKDDLIKQKDQFIEQTDRKLSDALDLVKQKEAYAKQLNSGLEKAKEDLAKKDDLIAQKDTYIKEKEKELADSNDLIKQKDEFIKESDSKLANALDLVKQKDQFIEETDRKLSDALDLVKQKETYTKQLNSGLEKAKEDLAKKDDLIAQKDTYIKEKEKELADSNDLIKQKDEFIKESDSKLANALDLVKQKDQFIEETDRKLSDALDLVKQKETYTKQLNSGLEKAKEDLAKKDDLIAQKDTYIKEKEKELADSNDLIKQKDEFIKESDSKLTNALDLVKQKESFISKQKDEFSVQLSLKDKQINKKEEELSYSRSLLKQKDLFIDSQKHEILEKDSAISSAASEIAEIKHLVDEKNDLINQKNSYIAQKESELSNSIDLVKQKDDFIAKQSRQLDDSLDLIKQKDNYIADLTNSKENLESSLSKIYSSTGYKFLAHYYKFRDFFVPPNSKRKAVLKTIGFCFKHPVVAMQAIKRGKVSQYFRELNNNSNVLEAKMISYKEKVQNIGSIDDLVLNQTNNFAYIEFEKIKHPIVSIIVPVYNQFKYTYNCLLSVLQNANQNETPYEIIVVDDCSTDETKNIEKYIGGIRLIVNKTNQGFVRNNNNAAKIARGKYLYLLNNDTNVQPGFLKELVDVIENDSTVGACGSKLVYSNGTLQEAGGIIWKDGSAWNYGNQQDPTLPDFNYLKDVDYISGAALMVRKDLWNEIGGFDTRFIPAYCEDSDMCLSVQSKGYKVKMVPTSLVVHYEGVSNGKDTSTGLKKYQVENNKKLIEKWKDFLKNHENNAENVFWAKDKSKGKPTMLFVDHYVPHYDKDAGSRTVFAYLRLFAEMGFNIKFIGDNFFRHEPYTTTLQKMGIEVLYGNFMFNNWKQYIIDNGKYFDYVFLNRPHIAIKYIDIVKQYTKAKIIYYGHDLHTLRLQREYEVSHNDNVLKDKEKFEEMENKLISDSDLVYYPSNIEIDFLKEKYPNKDLRILQPYLFSHRDNKYSAKKRKDLLFVGGFNHGPNVDAILYFVKEVFPLILKEEPSTKLHVVGSCMPEEVSSLASAAVIIEGFVDDIKLSELYNSCLLDVAPLRYGAGVKGKIVEAMAFGIPTITSSCGAEGISGASDGLAIFDDPKQMAGAIVKYIRNPKECEKLSLKETDIINKYYSVENARKNIEIDLNLNGGNEQ